MLVSGDKKHSVYVYTASFRKTNTFAGTPAFRFILKVLENTLQLYDWIFRRKGRKDGRKGGRELSNGVLPNSLHFVRFRILITATNAEITILGMYCLHILSRKYGRQVSSKCSIIYETISVSPGNCNLQFTFYKFTDEDYIHVYFCLFPGSEEWFVCGPFCHLW
jgi:hypothetical protein